MIFCVISVGCCCLFVPHNKGYNGTFLLDRIMINIPLGANITIKVPVDIIFHNISSFGSYIMVELIFRHMVFPSFSF